MCVGVPGKIKSVDESSGIMRMGKVNFGGIVKDICLAYEPEAKVDDYVLVHAGFAISRIDEQEAMEVFALLKELDELAELETE